MARRRKSKEKVRLMTRDEMAKKMMASNKEVARLQSYADKLASELSDERRRTRQIERAIGSLERDLDKEKGRVKELRLIRQRMLQEYYELGRCLSATREKWFEAERRLHEKTATYHIETRVADGKPQDDCEEGRRDGS